MPIWKRCAPEGRSLFFLISNTLNTAVKQHQVFNTTKVLIAGDFVEATFFKRRFDWSDSDPEAGKAFSLLRSRTTLKRLINMNAGKWYDDTNKRYFLPQFITFTFAFNEVLVSAANREFMFFIKRLNRALGCRKSVLKYSAVIEFQARGAIHYHVLFYNMPFIEHHIQFFRDIWTWGQVMPKSVYNVADLGSYLTKYMVKGFDDPRLFGKKRYWNSRGLRKPIVFLDDDFRTFDILDYFHWRDPFYNFENENMIYKTWWLGSPACKSFRVPVDEKLSTVSYLTRRQGVLY